MSVTGLFGVTDTVLHPHLPPTEEKNLRFYFKINN
jgi:hypothetical protein